MSNIDRRGLRVWLASSPENRPNGTVVSEQGNMFDVLWDDGKRYPVRAGETYTFGQRDTSRLPHA